MEHEAQDASALSSYPPSPVEKLFSCKTDLGVVKFWAVCKSSRCFTSLLKKPDSYIQPVHGISSNTSMVLNTFLAFKKKIQVNLLI